MLLGSENRITCISSCRQYFFEKRFKKDRKKPKKPIVPRFRRQKKKIGNKNRPQSEKTVKNTYKKKDGKKPFSAAAAATMGRNKKDRNKSAAAAIDGLI
jgi:hypothetical protein